MSMGNMGGIWMMNCNFSDNQLQYRSESYIFKKCNLKKVLPIMFFLNLVWPSFCRPRQTNEIKCHDFVAVKKLSAEQKKKKLKKLKIPCLEYFQFISSEISLCRSQITNVKQVAFNQTGWLGRWQEQLEKLGSFCPRQKLQSA